MLTLPKIPSALNRSLVFLDVYQTVYGIFNHRLPNINKSRPLAVVAMHEKENPKALKLFREHAKRFAMLKIKDTLGISLLEYLNLSTSEINDLNTIAESHIAKRNDVISELSKELDE